MRNYTSMTQKIEIYSEKYKLSKENVKDILSKHEDLLTMDELKIKYDNPNAGKLPDWLEEEKLDKIIWKTVHQTYTAYSRCSTNSKEDLYIELQIYTRLMSNNLKNYSFLKTSLVNRVKRLTCENERRSKYFAYSIDEEIRDDNSNNQTKSNFIQTNDEEKDTFELIQNILSIKDEDIKQLLIFTAYLVCNINSFEKLYYSTLQNCSDIVKQNLKNIENILLENEEIKNTRLNNTKTLKRTKNINISNIVKAMQIGVEKGKNLTNANIQDYINKITKQYDLENLLTAY